MILQPETIRTRDGHQLELNLYLPENGGTGKVLVIGPGAGTEQAVYVPFAKWCAGQGMAVVCFRYRGAGEGFARHARATLRQWANQDLDAVLLFAHKRFPQYELVFLGHCISGEIAGIAPASEYIDRMILVASALSCWRLWPRRSQFFIWLIKLMAPLLSFLYGYFPGARLKFLGDMPRGVVREFSDWCNQPNGLFDVFPDNNYRKLNIPLLALTFSDDWFTPPRAVAALLSHFSAAKIQWMHLDPATAGFDRVGHDGFFHPSCQHLWQTTFDWIQNPVTTRGYFF